MPVYCRCGGGSQDRRRNRRGIGVHRRRAAAAVPRPPRPRRGVGHRRHPGRHPVAALYPSLAAAYPDIVFATFDAGHGRRRRPRLPGPAPRGVPAAGAGARRRRPGARIVDLAADFRLRDPAAYRAVVRRGPPRPRAPRAGSPTASPSCTARTSPAPRRWPPPAATRRPPPWPSPPSSAPGAIETSGHRGRRRQRRVGRGTGPEAHDPLRHRQRGLRRLRAPRPPPHARDRAGHRRHRPVHPPPRPHDQGDPGHLLRPPDRPHLHRRPPRPPAPTPTPASRSSWWATEPPSTKATWGSNTAHLTARFDPRTGWVVVLAALDNLVKGASGQAVQCANLLLGLDETAGLAATGCTRERGVIVPRGLRGRRRRLRDQAERRPRPGPRGHRRRPAGAGRRRLHHQQGHRRGRCRSAGPTWPPPGDRPRPSS